MEISTLFKNKTGYIAVICAGWLLFFAEAAAHVPNEDFPVIETATVIALKAKKGAVLKPDIRIKNTGNADLLITKVDPSCGCTISRFDKKPIKPGSTSVIALEIDTGEKTVGKNFVNVVIVSNTKYKFTKVRVDIDVQ